MEQTAMIEYPDGQRVFFTLVLKPCIGYEDGIVKATKMFNRLKHIDGLKLYEKNYSSFGDLWKLVKQNKKEVKTMLKKWSTGNLITGDLIVDKDGFPSLVLGSCEFKGATKLTFDGCTYTEIGMGRDINTLEVQAVYRREFTRSEGYEFVQWQASMIQDLAEYSNTKILVNRFNTHTKYYTKIFEAQSEIEVNMQDIANKFDIPLSKLRIKD